MPRIVEPGVALAVAGRITAGPLENRRRGRAPDVTTFQILEIDRLIGLIGNRIVRPGIDLVLLAVAGPVEARAFCRHLKAEMAVGNDIDPGRGSLFPARQADDIFPAILAETAQAVEKLQVERFARCECGLVDARLGTPSSAAAFLPVGQRVQLVCQRAAPCAQVDPGRRPEGIARLGPEQIGAQQVDLALTVRTACGRQRGMNNSLQRLLQLLGIGCRTVVEDHQIDRQALQPPVFVRIDHLQNEGNFIFFADPHQRDGKVPRYAGAPQRRGGPPAPLQDFRRSPEARIVIDQIIRQQLEQMGIVRPDAQILQLGLGMGGRQGGGAFKRHRVMVAVHQIHDLLAALRHHCPECDCDGLSARYLYPAAQAENRIEHGAGAVRQGPAFRYRRCRARASVAPQEFAAIGLILHVADRPAFRHAEMGNPNRLLRRRARPAGRQKRAGLAQIFGLHEQFGKGLVGVVVLGPGQRQFGIGGDFEIAQPGPVVGDRYPPHFRIVFRRHQHFGHRRNRAVGTAYRGAILGIYRFILFRVLGHGMIPRRPDPVAVDIAQIDECAPVVAGRVLPPAGEGHAAPAAVAAAGGGDHQAVAAVGQQVGPRDDGIGREETARHPRRLVEEGDGTRLHFGRQARHGDVAGHALLQQQLGRLDHGLAMEAFAHRAVMQCV